MPLDRERLPRIAPMRPAGIVTVRSGLRNAVSRVLRLRDATRSDRLVTLVMLLARRPRHPRSPAAARDGTETRGTNGVDRSSKNAMQASSGLVYSRCERPR